MYFNLSAPYGIREATERIGIHKENYTISEEHLPTHIPSKIEYGFSQIYEDLLKFSARHLKVGGRLVCWLPILKYVTIIEGKISAKLVTKDPFSGF